MCYNNTDIRSYIVIYHGIDVLNLISAQYQFRHIFLAQTNYHISTSQMILLLMQNCSNFIIILNILICWAVSRNLSVLSTEMVGPQSMDGTISVLSAISMSDFC